MEMILDESQAVMALALFTAVWPFVFIFWPED
jgi:hypothetical protein